MKEQIEQMVDYQELGAEIKKGAKEAAAMKKEPVNWREVSWRGVAVTTVLLLVFMGVWFWLISQT